ncbi:MAG: hypothetical protein SVX43_04010 [Cyanobacteriota bacterium]|nr:hypothetical protein [Cyanobacteriota bacterium]
MYNYPQLELICDLAENLTIGPEDFQFSPNDRFLVILFSSAKPEDDNNYPDHNDTLKNITYSKLFDTRKCIEDAQFARLGLRKLGHFSENSKFYELINFSIFIENQFILGSWRFDLTNNQLYRVEE